MVGLKSKKKGIREFLEMAKFKTRIKKNVPLLQVRPVQSDAANNQLLSSVVFHVNDNVNGRGSRMCDLLWREDGLLARLPSPPGSRLPPVWVSSTPALSADVCE